MLSCLFFSTQFSEVCRGNVLCINPSVFLKMSEEAKRSMIEWQEKLDKVTRDSEERILELQQKLTKVQYKVDRVLLNTNYNSSSHKV